MKNMPCNVVCVLLQARCCTRQPTFFRYIYFVLQHLSVCCCLLGRCRVAFSFFSSVLNERPGDELFLCSVEHKTLTRLVVRYRFVS